MKKYLVSLAVLLCVSFSAYATDGTWSKTTLHYNIYSSGGFATMPFSPPPSVPISGTTITLVTYNWSHYQNGNTNELVELCYSAPYSSIIGRCTPITASQTGTSPNFNGLSARGSFWVRHTITGGTYTAVPANMSDIVTVNYTY